MAKTIGNPLSWSAKALGRAGHHMADVAGHVPSDRALAPPEVRQIGMEDIRYALRQGLSDFAAFRSDVIFLCLVYPVIGLTMVWAASNAQMAPLIFPLVGGFALLGPVAALALYEMSRRREMELSATWGAALNLVRAPSIGAIVLLGLCLLGMFLGWLAAAYVIFLGTLGPELPTSSLAFLRETLTTGSGWTMILIGIPVGAVFAGIVLATSVVAFPLLLDRNVGVPVAVATSLRVTRANPGAIAIWGVVVAVSLMLASLPFFLGMVVVLPVLGHATWHLYRRAIA